MLRRIKTLVMMQIGAKFDLSFIHNKGRAIANLAVKLVIFVLITMLIKMLIPIFQNTLSISIDLAFFQTIIFITQLASLITCTIGLMNTLYTSADNTILLALPVKHSEIFISKLIVYYFYEFRKNILLIMPLFIGYGLQNNVLVIFDAYYIFKVLLVVIIIPLFPVFIGAIISIPLVFITNFLKRHPLLNALTIAGLMFLVFGGISSIVSVVTIQKHLRLAKFREIISDGINSMIPFINKNSLFYNNIINAVFSGRRYLVLFNNLGILLLVLLGLVSIVFTVSLATYFKLSTHSFEQAKKRRYRKKMKQIKNSYLIFLNKEFKMLIRSSNQLVSQFFILLLLPFLLYIVNLVFFSLKISNLGAVIVIGVNLLIGLIILMAANTNSATALTREGSEFYLLKTSPTKVRNITWAKITINIVVSIVVILASIFALNLSNNKLFSFKTISMMGIAYLFLNTGHIFWCYELDLLNPKMHEYAATQSVDDNPNATKSILIGTVMSILVGGLMIAMLFENVFYAWVRLIAISFAFLIVRLYMLIDKSKIYFKDIE